MKLADIKIRILLLLCLLSPGLSACGLLDVKVEKEEERLTKPEKQEELIGIPEFDDAEDMDEVTVEGDRITFTVYENQALPYRWTSSVHGEAITLVSEETVEGDGNIFAAGVSPAYHIFVFQWNGDGEAMIELIHARYDSDDREEAAKIRCFWVTKYGDDVTCAEQ